VQVGGEAHRVRKRLEAALGDEPVDQRLLGYRVGRGAHCGIGDIEAAAALPAGFPGHGDGVSLPGGIAIELDAPFGIEPLAGDGHAGRADGAARARRDDGGVPGHCAIDGGRQRQWRLRGRSLGRWNLACG